MALNPHNKQIVAWHVGGRGKEDAEIFFNKIPAIFREQAGFFTDYWAAYGAVIKDSPHFPVGKDSGLTCYIERFNCTLRQRLSRFVRKNLGFSKSLFNHIGAFCHFICQYNLEHFSV